MTAERTPKRTARLSRRKSSRKKSARPESARQTAHAKASKKNLHCPIVGIGGSAGGILPTDIGRRITELKPNIDLPDLENILRDVNESLRMRERKVKGPEGREYSLRVRPYRTIDNKIDGAVITLVELGGGEAEPCL